MSEELQTKLTAREKYNIREESDDDGDDDFEEVDCKLEIPVECTECGCDELKATLTLTGSDSVCFFTCMKCKEAFVGLPLSSPKQIEGFVDYQLSKAEK
jgi:hypothetical protein